MKYNFDQYIERRNTRSVKWDEAAEGVLPLWVADMDFATAPCVQQAIVRRAMHPCYGYTLVPDEYYASIIRWFWERHGWHIRREEILYTIGVVPAIAAILKAMTQLGDNVVILTPIYNCFYNLIRNAGCQAAEVPLRVNGEKSEEGGEGDAVTFSIDWERLEEALAQEKSTVMLLCNPHNPVGRIWTEPELQRVAGLCVKHHVQLISDEIHNELTRPGTDYVPLARALATSQPRDLTTSQPQYAVCTSPSKSFNIAGLQNANVIVPDPELRRRIDRAINLNETCDVNPFGVEAVIAAYSEGDEWLDELRQYIWGNYDFARAYLNKECPGIRIADLQATYLMWAEFRGCTMTSAEVSRRLQDEAGVWFTAGSAYGRDGEGWLRINLATCRATLAEALQRFVQWMKAQSSSPNTEVQ